MNRDSLKVRILIRNMPYRKTARVAARLADNRDRIVQAARRLVAESGFRDAQIVAIAAAAGVATGSVYRHFPSKAELFTEVLAITSRHEVEVLAAIAAAGGPASARLADAIRAFAARALRARALAYALIAEPVDPEIDAARRLYRHAVGEVFARILADGVRAGEFPAHDVAAAAACAVGALLEGLVGPLAPAAKGDARVHARVAESIVEFCLHGVGAERTAGAPPPRAVGPGGAQ